MRVARPAVALGIVAVVAVAAQASAASSHLTLTDATGDANAVNNQGVQEVPVEGNIAGPTQRPEADLVSLTFAPMRTAAGCGGFTATVILTAPPGDNQVYRISAQTRDSDMFWLEHQTTVTETSTQIRSKRKLDDDTKHTPIAAAQRVGNKVVFTVTAKDLHAAGERAAGLTLFAPSVEVRTAVSAGTHLTVPAWDIIDRDETKSFTPCG